MKPLAQIPLRIPRSGIREVMDLALVAEKQGPVIHLEVGQPDFATPAHIVEATCRAVREGHTRYISTAGIGPLREAAARSYERRTGVPTSASQILVTTGAMMSLATAFMTLLEAGDEVLLPDPGWPNYSTSVALARGVCVPYTLQAPLFLPDLDQLQSLVTPKTKILLVCSPSNPTGQVHDAALTEALVAFARRNDLWVVSDEIYSEIVFGGPAPSVLSFDTDERCLVVSGVSKTYAMTGYRIGFTRGRQDYITVAAKLQEPFVSCGTAFSQLAAVAALEGPQDCVAEMRAAYHRRRDIALDVLRARGLYRYTPGGAFYVMVDISDAAMSSREFTLRLLEEKRVAVAPGGTFGAMSERAVRVSVASSDEDVREGVTRICDFIAEAKARAGK
ncbi:MAG: pyridoxal phosphate-dependent aminotransferase [Vicinamibacteria bacterium]|nr:pyridoxal phosphate-dependent aminotransferase [Vicinamibacteria bacterium]